MENQGRTVAVTLAMFKKCNYNQEAFFFQKTLEIPNFNYCTQKLFSYLVIFKVVQNVCAVSEFVLFLFCTFIALKSLLNESLKKKRHNDPAVRHQRSGM